MNRNSIFALLQNHSVKISLFFIMLFGVALRVYGLNFPLYHWDEKLDFGNSIFAAFSQYKLMVYTHGSFLNYVELALWSVFLLLKGASASSQNMLMIFLENPDSLVLVPRFLIVAFSVLTVWLTYYVGKKFFDTKTGIIAAFFLALNFLHISQSHYVRGHIPSVFFVLLAAFFSFRMLQQRQLRDYLYTGICIGLATSLHFPLVILVFPFVFFHIFIERSRSGQYNWSNIFLSRSFLLGLFSVFFAFIVVTPYALLDSKTYISQMKYFILQASGQVWVSSDGQPVFLFYFTEHLKNGMGLLLETLSIVGLFYAFVRRSRADVVLLVFTTFLLIVISGKANFARYALVLLPFLMVFAARFLVELAGFFPQRSRIYFITIVVLILVIPSTSNVLRYDYYLTQPDTREQARVWFSENIPSGAKIVSEGANVLSPNLPLSLEYIEKSLSGMEDGSYAKVHYQALRDLATQDTGYEFITVFKLDEHHEGEQISAVENASLYPRNDVEYLVTVSWMQRSDADAYSSEFQVSLDALYEEIAVFEPTIPFRWDPYAWRVDYEALSRVRIGEPIVGGPRLVVYQLR